MLNFDDPKTLALIQMGLGLLGGAPGKNKNFGADLGHAGLLGLQGYQQGRQFNTRQREEEQQRAMRDMQMQEMRKAMEQRGQIADLAKSSFAPPQQLDPRQQEGGQQMVPGGGGMEAFAKGMMGIDPFKAAQLMPKPKMAFAPNGQAVDMNNLQPGQSYAAPTGPEIGKTRDIYRGGTLIQQEWDGKQWSEIGSRPTFKPDAPEKPSKPQLYDGATGPMMIGPDGRATPVLGPDNKPLGPKKGDKPLTESQAKATLYVGMMDTAEKAAAASGFDPKDLSNQTMLAFARGDIPKLPKSVQNVAASPPSQKYAQSTFMWTEAMLRQLTGAAAPETEVWRQVKTYWPMPGDSPEVIEQKAESRKQVSQFVRIVAAGGADKVDGIPSQSGSPSVEDLVKKYTN